MCPTVFISDAFARHGVQENWNYRYNVKDPAQVALGLGTPHTAEIGAIWGPENSRGAAPASYYPGGENAWITPLMQGYWTSFIKTLDPNTLRPAGAPMWETFRDAAGTDGHGEKDENMQRRILFDTVKTTGMEEVSVSMKARCQYLNSIGVEIRQ
jgi:carboxylesterase type B